MTGSANAERSSAWQPEASAGARADELSAILVDALPRELPSSAPARPRSESRLPYAVGERFLKFDLIEELGRGGQAVVMEGYDSFLDRTVAIKFIAPSPSQAHLRLAQRARAEARVLSCLQHENIVRVFDAGPLSDGSVYIVMERLWGQTLRAALKQRGTLSVSQALSLGVQISRGVEAAHAQGVIHRDLKPENVFIEAHSSVKVVDFGIAKVMGDDGNTSQKEGVPGTVLYMSPEHLLAQPVTPRSDVYALGTMLYEALYQHPARHFGLKREWVQVALMQVKYMPPSLNEAVPSIPPFVARVVKKAIAKDPKQRYASMGEFRQALEGALARHEKARAREASGEEMDDLSLPLRRSVLAAPAAGAARLSHTPLGEAQADSARADEDPAPLQKATPVSVRHPPSNPRGSHDPETGKAVRRVQGKARATNAPLARRTRPQPRWRARRALLAFLASIVLGAWTAYEFGVRRHSVAFDEAPSPSEGVQ